MYVAIVIMEESSLLPSIFSQITLKYFVLLGTW